MRSQLVPYSKFIYSSLRKVPIIGTVFRVFNAYAYKGHPDCNLKFAPFKNWYDRIIKKSLIVLIFVELICLYYGGDFSSIPWQVDDTILSVFPGILGFGIGVFALLFIMPSSFLIFIDSNRKRLSFGPEIVPVDIAYPLIFFTLAIGWVVAGKLIKMDFFNVINIWVFFYGIALTFELISFLFNSSLLIQKITLEKNENERINKSNNYIRERLSKGRFKKR